MRSFWRRWELLLPAVLGAAGETALVGAYGPPHGAALGPQLTAPPPLDVLHDLRWISVYHQSPWMLALELAAMLAARSGYAAWIVQRAWPNDHPPSLVYAFRRALVFYAFAALLLAPWVIVLFGLALTHVSFLFFVAAPVSFAIALVLPQGALTQAAGHWWRWSPSLAAAGWQLAALVWLTVAGGLISWLPLPLAVLVAAGAGVLDSRATFEIVGRIGRAPEIVRRRSRVLAPAITIGIVAATTAGAAAGFSAATPHTAGDDHSATVPRSASGRPVLVLAGFNSRWSARPSLRIPPGFHAWRYSYRGTRGRAILPYRASDTLQSLALSARKLAVQVRLLHDAYHRPVALVAESEGALVARTYLLRIPHDPRLVSRVILLDMPDVTGAVTYPPPGRWGWGWAGGWGMRALSWVIRTLGPLVGSADSPFLRDLASCPRLMHALSHAPAPGHPTEVWLHALADSADGYASSGPPGSVNYVVTATHGGLIRKARVQSLIGTLLRGSPRPPSRIGLAILHLSDHLARAWNTPGLVPSLRPRSCPIGGAA